ncbi:unnamed protein product [Zymoseptoria tritici ST99CH_1A5]|uniref:Methyltransferase domain-containing protein n=1 Tax=Zymoseptoria tritici ST99CH_1A5 TaxID=1276529 RepID=A0A1Y6L962_ZYMTR|nr:unnamed protein product [Zymoseptoria tritici ST99CH_1A5]
MPWISDRRLAIVVLSILALLVFFYRPPATQGDPLSRDSPNLGLCTAECRRAQLHERMVLSEKIWQRSVNLRTEIPRRHPQYPAIPFFKANFAHSPYTLWDLFPATWTCPHDMQRIGNLGDGGKWVCGLSIYETVTGPEEFPHVPYSEFRVQRPQEGLVVYSFGIAADSSFEAELLDRVPSIRIWGYDDSATYWGPQISGDLFNHRVFFAPFRLASEDSHSGKASAWTISSLMKRNGHDYVDILKIDIEGSEYGVLDALIESIQSIRTASGRGVLPIGQILIELHAGKEVEEATGKSLDFLRFQEWWERLESMDMRPVWMEVNLLGITSRENNTDPDCAEYVFVNVLDEQSVLWR